MYPAACSGNINYRPTPTVALRIDDLDLKTVCIRCGEFHGAAYARTTISTEVAVWAVRGVGVSDETAEYSMDDRVAFSVGARLETSVTDIRLAIEVELLDKKIAGFMGGVYNGEW